MGNGISKWNEVGIGWGAQKAIPTDLRYIIMGTIRSAAVINLFCGMIVQNLFAVMVFGFLMLLFSVCL